MTEPGPRSRPLVLAIALAAAVSACGCSAAAQDGASGPGGASPGATATATTARAATAGNGDGRHAVRPRGRGHRPAALAATRRRLAASHAPADAVQPQPRPGSCHARGSGLLSLPDPRCTPGAVDPRVSRATIDATICRSGYTRTVRPPESITEREKVASLAAYGDRGALHDYEYDHLVPLELGGAPNDPRNLWPEPGTSPNPKDRLENHLRALVCDGEIGLAAAQQQIAGDWVSVARRLGG